MLFWPIGIVLPINTHLLECIQHIIKQRPKNSRAIFYVILSL